MKPLFLLLATLLSPTLLATLGFAYHGSLQEANGAAFNLDAWQQRPPEERTFIFALYTQPTEDVPLWSATFSGAEAPITPDHNGVFTVELNDGFTPQGLPQTFFETLALVPTTPLYLGITVGKGTKELSPRQQILSVPYAATATTAEGNAQDFTAQGLITSSDLAINNALTLETLAVSDLTELTDMVEVESLELSTLTVAQETTFMDEVSAETIEGEWALPIGSILPFFGTDDAIPEGWALCNGENGTPNLNDCFLLGADDHTYPFNQTGGNKTLTLEAKHLPEHTHSHTRTIYSELYNFWGEEDDTGWDRWSRRVAHSRTSSSGEGLSSSHQAIEILPPYLYLRYIMRTH
jgi:hypothetical protein